MWNDILHRDLKTDKIYFDDFLLPKIGGFGCSKFKNSIVTSKDPYPDYNPVKIKEDVLAGKKPKIDKSIPNHYKNLIQKCWSQNPIMRQTFDEIVEDLETNLDFITDEEEEEYKKYIEYIKDPTTFPYDSEDMNSIFKLSKKKKKKFECEHFLAPIK